MLEEIAGLHEHAELSGSQTSPLGFWASRHALAHHRHCAAVGLVQAGEAGK